MSIGPNEKLVEMATTQKELDRKEARAQKMDRKKAKAPKLNAL